MYRQLDLQLPKLPLPVRIHETRKKFQSKAEQSLTMRGFSNFQENQFHKFRFHPLMESTMKEAHKRSRSPKYKRKYHLVLGRSHPSMGSQAQRQAGTPSKVFRPGNRNRPHPAPGFPPAAPTSRGLRPFASLNDGPQAPNA